MNARRLLVLFVLLVAVVPASSATASYPGVVGRIVFTSDRNGTSTGEIYSAAADGTDVKRLTWTDGFEQDPAWSADGSHIAYESTDQGRFHLFVMNQDGSDQHLISPNPSSTFDDWQPAWSPDGTQIAFASTRPFGSAWHVWVMNADGTNLRVLPGDLTQSPVWSPDGSRIAGSAGSGSLFIVNADGTGEQALTSPAANQYDEVPDWSPDGTSLVFSERTLNGPSALFSIGADGSGEHQLTSGAFSDYAPSWSPNGAQIVFVRRVAAGDNFQLYTVAAAGGAATQLLGSVRNDMGPSWGSSTISPVPPPPPGAPHITIYSPVDGSFYFPGQASQVFYACTSDVSPVTACDSSQPIGATIDTSFAGAHNFTVTATDLEGRQASATVTYTVPDLTPPSIELRTPVNAGGYDLGANVTVDFSCVDTHGGSGIQLCQGTLPNGAPLDTSHAGTFTFQVTALDNAHNLATATSTYSVVDRTPPSVSITTPADQAVYKQDQLVAAAYTCSDSPGGSGVLSCSGNVASGAAIDTSTVGTHSFAVTAEKAGHVTTTASRSYTVLYNFSGFFPPVGAFPSVNRVKAGERLPLKFSLHGNRGSDIFAPASPAWAPCSSPAASTSVSGALSYNAWQDRYTFLATTQRSWAGTCKDMTVTLRDGTTRRVRFVFVK